MAGISNFTIEKIVNEIDDDLKANFVGVFPSNYTFKFLRLADLVTEKEKSLISFYDNEHR